MDERIDGGARTLVKCLTKFKMVVLYHLGLKLTIIEISDLTEKRAK